MGSRLSVSVSAAVLFQDIFWLFPLETAHINYKNVPFGCKHLSEYHKSTDELN